MYLFAIVNNVWEVVGLWWVGFTVNCIGYVLFDCHHGWMYDIYVWYFDGIMSLSL